jgi:uncharacterized protein YuzE
MKHRYLEVTYRKGKPVAAYLYFPRNVGASAVRTEDAGSGLRIDYDAQGKALGVEVTAPALATVEHLNGVLSGLGQELLHAREWAPLEAA